MRTEKETLPFTVSKHYCMSNHHKGVKNHVCYEKNCPSRGLICEKCIEMDHLNHRTMNVENYLNQVSRIFTSNNQEKLLKQIESLQLILNREISRVVERIYSLHLQLNNHLNQITSF